MGTTEQFDREIPVKPVLWIGVLIVVLMIGTVITMDWYLENLRQSAIEHSEGSAVYQEDMDGPELLANPEAHLEAYKAEQSPVEDLDQAMDSVVESQAVLEDTAGSEEVSSEEPEADPEE